MLRTFGLKRDEVTGSWKKLYILYSSTGIIRTVKSRRMRWAEHVTRFAKYRNTYRISVGKPEIKRPVGRPRRRRENNIKTNLREIERSGKDRLIWLRGGTNGELL
jgi:hypothetical protein